MNILKSALFLRALVGGLLVFILGSIAIVDANSLNVPTTHVLNRTVPVNVNDIKPAACTMVLDDMISGAGNITGTAGNDLIIGSSGNDSIDGLGGDDCIIGGSGDDTLDGNAGNDVCIGGSGSITYLNCETTLP